MNKESARELVRLAPLSFPRSSDPLVSIVIPVFNKWRLTYECLRTLRAARTEVAYEVIIVDDASSDATQALLAQVDGITVATQTENGGFLRACGAGARRASGAYLGFLNNDCEPTDGWLDEAISVFLSFPDVGLVGSKLVYADGRLQEAGGIVWSTGDPFNYGSRDGPRRTGILIHTAG